MSFDTDAFAEKYPTLQSDLDPYAHESKPVRSVFWQRLYTALDLAPAGGETALDFGTGSGVMLVLCSPRFKKVVGLDSRIRPVCREIVSKERLSNVTLVQADGNDTKLPGNSFDVAFATDVLEHFLDLKPPLKELRRVLKPGGSLVVSAPTENLLYNLYRLAYGRSKPRDHYHDSNAVLAEAARFFQPMEEIGIPFNLPPALTFFRVKRFVKRQ